MRYQKTNKRAMVLILGLLLAGSSAYAGLTVYDDFSSNDLSLWTDGTGFEMTTSVSGGALTWVGNAGTSWGAEYITSTKNDFDLSASVANPLGVAMDLVGITPRTDADTSYEALIFGWTDASGDDLQFIYSMRGASALNDSVVQVKYNGAQIGGNAFFANAALLDGDTVIGRWDGATVSVVRDRAGTETILASRSFSDASFTGTGSIYQGLNFEGASGASVVIDSFSVQSIPEPATLGMIAMVSGALLFVRRQMMM